MKTTESGKSIILFDGACGFCNLSVSFIIRHDKKNSFRFVPFQTAASRQLLKKFSLNENYSGSLVLIEGNTFFLKSTAALRIARTLNPPVNWLSVFILVPKFLRDPVYDWIARHRNSWFGKQNSCVLPRK